jgi:hypothetical protein
MCDWAVLPAGEFGHLPFFGLQDDTGSCLVASTGNVECADTNPSSVFAAVGGHLHAVRFGGPVGDPEVHELEPCYWYDARDQTLCRPPIAGENTRPVMLDGLLTDQSCTFGEGRYTHAATPAVPDSRGDVVDLRLILYTLNDDGVEQIQTILADVPVDMELTLETWLDDTRSGILDWQTTDELVTPSDFKSKLVTVRDPTLFDGLAVLTMAVMPKPGDTRRFETRGKLAQKVQLVRRRVVRRMDVTPVIDSNATITDLLTIAQLSREIRAPTSDDAVAWAQEKWIKALNSITWQDANTPEKRKLLNQRVSELHRNKLRDCMSDYRTNLRTSREGHECTHETHRLFMSPILHGAFKDYTLPVFDDEGKPVRTEYETTDDKGYVIPVPPATMQTDTWQYGAMPEVLTPPPPEPTQSLEFQIPLANAQRLADMCPNHEILTALCVSMQGFPNTYENALDAVLGTKMSECMQDSRNVDQSHIAYWMLARMYGQPIDFSAQQALGKDWETFAVAQWGFAIENMELGSWELRKVMETLLPSTLWDFSFTCEGMEATDTDTDKDRTDGKICRITRMVYNYLMFKYIVRHFTDQDEHGVRHEFWVSHSSSNETHWDGVLNTREAMMGRVAAMLNTEFDRQCTIIDSGFDEGHFELFCPYPNGLNDWGNDYDFQIVRRAAYLRNGACEATAHHQIISDTEIGYGAMPVMDLCLYRLFPDIYARLIAFLACRTMVDETPEKDQATSVSAKGLSRPWLDREAMNQVLGALNNRNLNSSPWAISNSNSMKLTRCAMTEGEGTHHSPMSSTVAEEQVCTEWLAFPSTAKYMNSPPYEVTTYGSNPSPRTLGRKQAISVLPGKIDVLVDEVEFNQSTTDHSVHENYTVYEWFAMFDHTKDTDKFKIQDVQDDQHRFQYTGFGQPLLVEGRKVTNDSLYGEVKPPDLTRELGSHEFVENQSFQGPFGLDFSANAGTQPAQWLHPKRNHLPPNQRQAALSNARFDIVPDFEDWRWITKYMADSSEIADTWIQQDEAHAAEHSTVVTGQCGWAAERADAKIIDPILQWTREEDGRTYRIDPRFGDSNDVLYIYRD